MIPRNDKKPDDISASVTPSVDSRVVEQLHYITSGGVRVQRSAQRCLYSHAIAAGRTAQFLV